MTNLLSRILSLFKSSRKISKLEFYYLRDRILEWNQDRSYPAYSALPFAIGFPSDFWDKVKEIYRHTRSDGHERAVTVWWADGQVILTHSVRGDANKVNIPQQQIRLEYKRTSNDAYAERVVTINGKVYSKNKVSWKKVPKKGKLRVQYLFNMHTHPPHGDSYSFFSLTDIRSFITSPASITGLVTNELWILMKTNLTPRNIDGVKESDIDCCFLKDQLKMRVYKGGFSKSVITV